MKRWIVLPGIVTFSVLWLCVYCMVSPSTPARSIEKMPVIDEKYMPGQDEPTQPPCRTWLREMDSQFCTIGELSISVKNRKIVEVSLWTRDTKITVGDLLLAWGRPLGATYEPYGYTHLYWQDSDAFILAADSFDPNSKVSYISYGNATLEYGPWQGFANNRKR